MRISASIMARIASRNETERQKQAAAKTYLAYMNCKFGKKKIK